jgi:hypothetical protein
MRRAPQLQVTDDERTQLQQWARGRRTPVRLALRAKMILLAAEGHENRHIAATVGTSRQTVGLWRQRFATQRLALPAGRQGGLSATPHGADARPSAGGPWKGRSCTPPPNPLPPPRPTGPREPWPGIWAPTPPWCSACGRQAHVEFVGQHGRTLVP